MYFRSDNTDFLQIVTFLWTVLHADRLTDQWRYGTMTHISNFVFESLLNLLAPILTAFWWRIQVLLMWRCFIEWVIPDVSKVPVDHSTLEDEGDTSLRNVINELPSGTASLPKDQDYINLLTPNVNYSWRTAPLTSKVAFYIFIQQI